MHQNEWATAIDKFWGNSKPGSLVLLMLEPTLLKQAAKLHGVHFRTAEDAEADFLEAVRSYLSGKSVAWDPEPLRAGVPPRFLLQIAVQVYAACRMANDPNGNFTETAYYVQLERMVGKFGARELFSLNLQGEFHQRLWRERLPEWAEEKQLRLQLPPDKQGAGRHVQLPKSQAVLRVGDLKRLPMFFAHRGFVPYDPDNPDEMSNQLERLPEVLHKYKREVTYFSSWARQVLDDVQKNPIARMQIAEALEHWDGSLQLHNVGVRPSGSSAPSEAVWLSIRSRPNRLFGFTGVSGGRLKNLDRESFRAIITGKPVKGVSLLTLGGIAIFRYEEEHSCYKNCEVVEAGDNAILVAMPIATKLLGELISCDQIVSDSFAYSSHRSDIDETLEGLPIGYRLAKVKMVSSFPTYDAISDAWRPFLKKPRFGLALCGGLRVNRKEEWIQNAGPYLRFSGNQLPKSIEVDGNRIKVTAHVMHLDCLSKRGLHEIVARVDGKSVTKRFWVSVLESNPDPRMPDKAWAIGGETWPQYSIASQNETTNDPRLHGIRCEGLKPFSKQAFDPTIDDRLFAIRLLAGLTIDRSITGSSHPLSRYLLSRAEVQFDSGASR